MADIRVEHMAYSYPDGKQALAELSMTVESGELACVLGPSGCGKTTTLQVLSGLAIPQKGTVTIGGQAIKGEGRSDRAEEVRCGYMFQDGRLLPWRTIRQNLEIAMRAAGVPKATWHGRIRELLELVAISEYEDAWPLNLSGGQRQRAALARALAIDPQVLLMDEPFGTLDEVTARGLRLELLRIWQATGITIVFVTHSIREAVFLADVVYLLTDGPGRLLERVPISLPRPRIYESPELAEIERSVTQLALREWGQMKSQQSLEEGLSSSPTRQVQAKR